jgi:hypothetical protein
VTYCHLGQSKFALLSVVRRISSAMALLKISAEINIRVVIRIIVSLA